MEEQHNGVALFSSLPLEVRENKIIYYFSNTMIVHHHPTTDAGGTFFQNVCTRPSKIKYYMQIPSPSHSGTTFMEEVII